MFNSTPLSDFFSVIAQGREQVPFSKDTESVEHIHERSPEHTLIGTVRLESQKNEGKQKRVNMEEVKRARNEEVP